MLTDIGICNYLNFINILKKVHVYILNSVQEATMPPDRSADHFIDADPSRISMPQPIITFHTDDETSSEEEEYVPISQPPTPEITFYYSDTSSEENIVTIEQQATVVSEPEAVTTETTVTSIQHEMLNDLQEPVRDHVNEMIHQIHHIESLMPQIRRLIRDQEAVICTLHSTLTSVTYSRESIILKQATRIQELVDKLYESELERNLYRMQNMLISAQLNVSEHQVTQLQNQINSLK